MGITELQRREQYVKMFTAQEKQLFLPIVRPCLENRPDKRPSSVMLVQELRRIESSLPTGSDVAVTIEQLRQQLSAKEEECRQKDEVIRENDKALREKEQALKEKDIIIRMVEVDNHQLRSENNRAIEIRQQLATKEEECRQKDVIVREKSATIKVQQAEIQRLRGQPAVPQEVG